MANDANLVINVTDKGSIKKSENQLKGLTKEGKKAESQFKSFGKNASAAVAAIDGPLGGISSRLSSLTTVLTSGTAAITAAALAVTGLGFATAQGVKALDEYNVNLARTEQILIQTGYAAGFSAQQLADQADALALATLTSTSEVQKAQAILATFNKVTGDTFTRTIELSQDLAESGFGSLTTAANGLGKALQDPITGMTLLTKQGSLTKNEQKAIGEEFKKTGDLAKAQGAILAALTAQVGGTGTSVAENSLAGKIDTAEHRWLDFTKALAASPGIMKTVGNAIDGISESLEQMTKTLTGGTLEEQFAATSQQVRQSRFEVEQLEKTLSDIENTDLASLGSGAGLGAQESARAKAQAELNAATDKYNKLLEEQQKTKDSIDARDQKNADIAIKSAETQAKIAEDDAKARQEELNAIITAEAQKSEAKLAALTQLNLTELELINQQEMERLALIASYREQEGVNQQLLDEAQAQTEINAYNRRKELREREQQEILDAQMATANDFERLEKNEKKKSEKEAKDKKSREKEGLDSSVAIITALGGAQSKAAKAALLTSQLYAQKELIIDNASAIGEAWASAPFPQNIPAVGAATAAFLPLLATVASARAEGGGLAAGQVTNINEREAELFAPNSNGHVFTQKSMQKMMSNAAGESGGGAVNNFYFTGYDEATVTEAPNATGGTDVYITRDQMNDAIVSQMGNPSSEGFRAMQGVSTLGRS